MRWRRPRPRIWFLSSQKSILKVKAGALQTQQKGNGWIASELKPGGTGCPKAVSGQMGCPLVARVWRKNNCPCAVSSLGIERFLPSKQGWSGGCRVPLVDI